VAAPQTVQTAPIVGFFMYAPPHPLVLSIKGPPIFSEGGSFATHLYLINPYSRTEEQTRSPFLTQCPSVIR